LKYQDILFINIGLDINETSMHYGRAFPIALLWEHFLMKRTPLSVAITALLCSITLNGCVTQPVKQPHSMDKDDCTHSARDIGMLLGAAVGAVIGNQSDDNLVKFASVSIGAIIGNLIGSDIDRQQCELQNVRKKHNLDMKITPLVSSSARPKVRNAPKTTNKEYGIQIDVRDPKGDIEQFKTGSARFTPRAAAYFREIARTLKQPPRAPQSSSAEKQAYEKMLDSERYIVIGHTDDTGDSLFNARLSQKRAKAVARILMDEGIPADRIFYQGAGETFPIADNRIPDGRRKNRRVEIVKVYGGDEAVREYFEKRKTIYKYYRPVDTRIASLADERKSAHKRAMPGHKSSSVNQASRERSSRSSGRNAINFGGHPVKGKQNVLALGDIRRTQNWWKRVIPEAYAGEQPENPAKLLCTLDRPHYKTPILSLKNNREYRVSRHISGLYGKTWSDKVNRHLVLLNRVSILKEEVRADSKPQFKVYPNYRGQKHAKPAVSRYAPVNTYNLENGILYRVFLGGDHGIQCADVLFPSNGGKHSLDGTIIYSRNGREFAAPFKPEMH